MWKQRKSIEVLSNERKVDEDKGKEKINIGRERGYCNH